MNDYEGMLGRLVCMYLRVIDLESQFEEERNQLTEIQKEKLQDLSEILERNDDENVALNEAFHAAMSVFSIRIEFPQNELIRFENPQKSRCRVQRWLSSRVESSSSRASNRTFLLEARDSRVRPSRTSIKYRSNSGKSRVEQGIWRVRLDFSNKKLLFESIRVDSSRVELRACSIEEPSLVVYEIL